MSISYRIFRLDRDGRIAGVEVIAADDDEAAFEILESRSYPDGAELWHEARVVGKVESPLSGEAT